MPGLENAQQNQVDEIVPAMQIALVEEDIEQPIAAEYLYSQHISALVPQCPPAEATECDRECWRFTLNPISHNCFWPPKEDHRSELLPTMRRSVLCGRCLCMNQRPRLQEPIPC